MPSRTLAVAALGAFVVSDPFSISIAQTALVVAGLCWAWAVWSEGEARQVRLPLLRPYLAFAAATSATIFVSDDPWRTLLGIKSLWLILPFYLAVNLVTSELLARRLLLGLLGAVAVSSIIGLLQAYRLGLAYRIRGTLSIYMTVAGILAIALLLAIAYALASRGRERVLAAALALPAGLAFVLTYTRNAWLGFALGVVLLSWALVRWWTLAILAFLAAASLVAVALIEPAAVRLKSMADLSDVTFVERLHIWRAGGRMIQEHPILGVGVKMPERLYPRYRDPEAQERIAHLHSDVLQIAAERGMIGLATWLAFWASFFVALGRLGSRGGSSVSFAGAVTAWSRAAVAAILLGGVFQYNFGDSEILMLLYFAMGVPFGLSRRAPEIKVAPARSRASTSL